MTTRLMNLPECASRADISLRTLQRAIARGEGPRLTRIGARVMVAEADHNAWLAQMAEQPRAA